MTNRAMPLEPVEVGCCTCSKGRATKVGGDQDRLHIICVLSYTVCVMGLFGAPCLSHPH